ncbi:Uncharacterised protein [Pseudomonas fragi]|uniref:Uncharacterized protein n=1 Tax=Pseudomonas fragi TaxID=296 RepID=A0A449IRM0_PSEFR|nr:Uncharacterised protein [Pseudomonas fragi]
MSVIYQTQPAEPERIAYEQNLKRRYSNAARTRLKFDQPDHR